jgi:hypothetical protein
MENVGVLARGKFWHCAENVGVQVCAVNCGAEYYYVRMHTLNLALHGEHAHSNVHMGCTSIT